MNNFEEQFPAGFHKKGLAGFFYVQEARAHSRNFGRSRSTERGEISYINGDTGGKISPPYFDNKSKRKGVIVMTLLDDHYRKVPEYYDWMYLDGFTPDEILYALHKKMDREQAEREAVADFGITVKIKSEVRIK